MSFWAILSAQGLSQVLEPGWGRKPRLTRDCVAPLQNWLLGGRGFLESLTATCLTPAVELFAAGRSMKRGVVRRSEHAAGIMSCADSPLLVEGPMMDQANKL